MQTPRILTLLLLFGVLACDDGSDDNNDVDQSDVGEPADIDPEPPLDSDPPEPIDISSIRSIEISETETTVKLVAIGLKHTPIGVMVLERRELEQADVDNPEPGDTWYPIYADGYFDVTGLDDDEVDARMDAASELLGPHPTGRIVWCAAKIAMSAAMCLDGPAVVVTCPVGLHAMVCECAPQLGVPKHRLAGICGD